MNRNLLKAADKNTLKEGDLVWLEGKWKGKFSFEYPGICGPFFVKLVLFRDSSSARIDLINPENGETKSVLSTWLRVPKEEK
tara:strand:- start:2131 stop:2376 length:246 start_codon:yes stop_codon:yes gene_type:complete